MTKHSPVAWLEKVKAERPCMWALNVAGRNGLRRADLGLYKPGQSARFSRVYTNPELKQASVDG